MSRGVSSPVTKARFDCVKTLLKSDTPISDISEYLTMSRQTIRRIKSVETYEEYKNETWRQTAAAKAKKAEERKRERERYEKEKETVHAEFEKVGQPVTSAAVQVPKLQQPSPQPQSVTIVANHYMAEELRKQTELLKLISNKLAYIVEQLS